MSLTTAAPTDLQPDTGGSRWYYTLILAVIATFFAMPHINSYAIAALVLSWFILFRFKFSWSDDLKIALFFSGFFGIHAVGMLYTDHQDTGLNDLTTKASILLFPLMYQVFRSLNQRQVEGVLQFFVGVTMVASVYTLVKALLFYLDTGKSSAFFYHDLSEQIGMHAIYMSMYVCFAILIVLQWLVSLWDKHSGHAAQVGLIILAFYLFGYNILLSARMPTLALCLVVFAGILKVFYDRRGLATGISIIVLVSLILIAGIYLSPVNRSRYKDALNRESIENSRQLTDGRTLRLMKWDCCADLLKENWLLGLGTGDVQVSLNNCYAAKHYDYLVAEGRQYNAHNQYFQTWLGVGLIGLLWFIGILGHGLYWSYKRQYYLQAGFVLTFALVCITESTLPVHKGVVFFMFFSMLLTFGKTAWPWKRVGE